MSTAPNEIGAQSAGLIIVLPLQTMWQSVDAEAGAVESIAQPKHARNEPDIFEWIL